MGEGVIYPAPMSAIAENQIQFLPDHWTKLWSLDFGIGLEHPFAAVLSAWDRDADDFHVVHVIKMVNKLPLQQCDLIRRVAGNVLVAWPHDGAKRDTGSGKALQSHYRDHGLIMRPEHATWPTGGYSVEAGILEMQQRMDTGRLHVARHLETWFEEQRLYHRKAGLIVKAHDDVLDATRIGIMDKRFGKPGPIMEGKFGGKRRDHQATAQGIDFDLFP